MGAIWAGPEQRNRRLNRLAYSSQAGDKLLPGHFLQVDAAPPLTHLRRHPIPPTPDLDKAHFTTGCFVRVIAAGAVGEIANVSHIFHPDGRLAAANSPYPLMLREPCMSATGKL